MIFLMLIILAGCEGGGFIGIPLSDGVAARALEFALSRVNCPYVLGAQGPKSFDCSGLVIWSYSKAFAKLKLHVGARVVPDATAENLWRYNVLPLEPQHIAPGDLIFVTNSESEVNHVGMFIRWVDDAETKFEFVHASASHGRVTIGTWSMNTEGGYWYVGAGRVKMGF